MHPIRFGYCVPIFAYPGERLFRTPNYAELDTATTLALARTADALGFDSLWVADHLMLGRDNAILEGWTTLAALAGSTQRALLGMIHQAHFFRNPALAAKMTATLDQISGGRFIYFIDSGYGRQEHLAYDLPYPDPLEERILRVMEGLEVTLALWQTRQPVTFAGRYYRVTDAVCNPPPVQKPHPPVWFGEAHPLTLQACARTAQGWNTTPVAPAELQQRLDDLKAACVQVGRAFDDIEKSLETQILIAPDRATLRRQLQEMIDRAPAPGERDSHLADFLAGATEQLPAMLTERWLAGTPAEVEHRLRTYIEMGITHFLLWFMDAPCEDGMRLFAEEVAPRVRTP